MSEIVVGIDDSAGARDALAFAVCIAASADASVRLATAINYRDVHSLTSPAHALHMLAEKVEADLLVVGSTHRGSLGRVIPGSTGERLVQGSPCPVAIVPRGHAQAGPIRRIGVGYDGSDESATALEAACLLARRLGATLRVIHVFDPGGDTHALMTRPGLDSIRDEARAAHRGWLDQAVAALPADVAAEPVFAEGDAGSELSIESGHLDLLLVGSRGYGPQAAVLRGGVTHTLIPKAACPVIVLPRGSRGLDALFSEAPPSDAKRAPGVAPVGGDRRERP